MSNYLPLLILFIGGATLTLGDIVMKRWVISNNVYEFIFGIFIYIIGMMFLSWSFKHKNIAVASTIFVVFNVITLMIVSWIFFKEPLSIKEILGISLGIIGILIMEI